MTFSPNDIVLVLSGGSSNTDPGASLGGNPSATPVINGRINNIFRNLTGQDLSSGITDYRCVYVFNDSNVPVYNIAIYIPQELAGGSPVYIGIQSQDEVQRLLVPGVITGGSFQLIYSQQPVTINWNIDPQAMAQSIQSSLNSLTSPASLPLLRQVLVTGQIVSDSLVIFDITFQLFDGSRDHDILQIVENNLTRSDQPNVPVPLTVQMIQQGSPINTIAPKIGVDTTVPNGITFGIPSEIEPIVLPRLMSMEGFPLWFKRVTQANSAPAAADGLAVRFHVETTGPF